MDNKKFGQFILKLRKEKGWTQLELAEKLNITDKAVSKWERGTGFPDIKMIEPLAEVFNVSILEIMQSERIPGQTIPKDYLQSPASFTLYCHIGVWNTGFIISVTYFSVFMFCFRIRRTGSDLKKRPNVVRIVERRVGFC